MTGRAIDNKALTKLLATSDYWRTGDGSVCVCWEQVWGSQRPWYPGPRCHARAGARWRHSTGYRGRSGDRAMPGTSRDVAAPLRAPGPACLRTTAKRGTDPRTATVLDSNCAEHRQQTHDGCDLKFQQRQVFGVSMMLCEGKPNPPAMRLSPRMGSRATKNPLQIRGPVSNRATDVARHACGETSGSISANLGDG
jgi:hypothetical protein